MDEITVAAMWSDAQVTLYQQRKIRKYLRFSFGSKIIIPEKKVQSMGAGYVKAEFGTYNFYKTPTAKPEKCNYWTRCLPTLLLHSTKHLLEQGTACKNHLMPYKIGSKLGWEIIIGADHGKGSWRSVAKVYHSDYPT